MNRAVKLLAGIAVAGLVSGCSGMPSAYDLPLPGGADVGDHPITLSADFDDVLDLVPQSSVKVDHVDVGKVTDITLNPDAKSAHVEFQVNDDVQLPAGTTARLQQTSLLGEKYIALIRPDQPTGGEPLKSGDELGPAKTSRAAEVEQVFGALSLVLNGGDLGKFQEISRELQKVSTGRSDEIRDFLQQMRAFVSSVDQRKAAITSALDGLEQLSTTLDEDKQHIVKALDGLSPGMQVLVDQRKQLVAMLQSLDRLSHVTIETLDASQDDIVTDLKTLRPILDQLAKSGSDLPRSLEILLTYPFPDSVLGAIKGDYLNVFITTNFRTLPAGCDAMGCAWAQPALPDDGWDDAGATAPSLRAQTLRAPSARKSWPSEPAPSLLPPTSSPLPGLPSPTMTVPSPSPSGSPSPSPAGEPTSSSSTADTPTTGETLYPSQSPSPSGTSSPTASSSPSPTPTASSTQEGEG